jgi:Ca2+-binding RTX toxin-like protein
MAIAVTIGPTGNPEIDGLLSGYKWSGALTYSMPTVRYGDATSTSYTFNPITTPEQQAAINWALTEIQAFTNISLSSAGTSTSADLRFGNSSVANPTSYAYYPNNASDGSGGDVWIGTQYNYQNPTLGTYEWVTHIHEIGHAFGLKHPHETSGSFPALGLAHDDLEYSVMSYRSYIGQSTSGGYTNEKYGFPQTYMMNDIIALQAMYGADYSTNNGSTVYTWSPTTGEMFINGVGQGRPGGANAPASANRVFLTIWDGGGNDTYDMSNYTTGVTIDLNPGSYSITSNAQRANLDVFTSGHLAQGNVYNAYLFNNDARSYIENAKGGSGSDLLIGNAVANRLDGAAGNDTLTGNGGSDVFVFWSGYSSDTITDFVAGSGATHDVIDFSGLSLVSSWTDILRYAGQFGANTVFNFTTGLVLTLWNVAVASLTYDDFLFAAAPPPPGPNSAPTDITLSSASIAENLVGATIGNVIVTDDHDTAFAFQVSDSRFQVVGTPGAYKLQLVSGVSLDYETEHSVALKITATDSGGLFKVKDFTITVGDMPGVTITGTAYSDTIDATHSPSGQPFATPENDTIYGMAGNDVIHGLAGNDAIDGGSGNDTLYGDDGNDTLTGGAGTDRLYGGNGDDSLVISGANDTWDIFDGGAGNDTMVVSGTGSVTLAGFNATASSIEVWQGNGQGVLGTSAANTFDFSGLTSAGPSFVDGGDGNDTITGTAFADDLRGNSGNDTLNGGDGNDTLNGGTGNDTLNGGANNDTITGGAGKDFMTGGTGADTFVFAAVSDSTNAARDTIMDFVHGVDKIDLHAIDANTAFGAPGNQDFLFFGSSTIAVANQVTFTQSGGNTIVSADTNGNSIPDIVIVLAGLHTLTANDFIL